MEDEKLMRLENNIISAINILSDRVDNITKEMNTSK